MREININEIRRHGNYIRLGAGITAAEGWEGNLRSLSIRKNGKQIKRYRGSSLVFCENLTAEDKSYLKSLVEG